MLNEISQVKTNTVWLHLYVEPKTQSKQNRNRLIDTEEKTVAAKGGKGVNRRVKYVKEIKRGKFKITK